MPKVSVIIPAYNQGNYLGQAIQSVLDQSYKDFELIIVDDGSTDNTFQIARSFKDERILYVYQENRGLSAARNMGLRCTTASFVTFLDSDDLFLKDKLALLIDEMETHPELDLVAGQAIPIDEEGRHIGNVFDKPLPEDLRLLLLGNPLHVGSVMLRRSGQERVGYFDESLRSYEDWDMWLRLAKAGGKMGWIQQPVSLYRFHTAQMTRIGNQMTTATFGVLDKIFKDPNLPEGWAAFQNKAYCNAFLRSAAQAYLAGDYDLARERVSKAIELNADLLTGEGRCLADHFIAWVQLPKTRDPFQFLERVFDHLPEEISVLHQYRRRHLGRAAIQMAFQAYLEGDYKTTRNAVLHAFRYQPQWIMNRGVVSILLRSSFK